MDSHGFFMVMNSVPKKSLWTTTPWKPLKGYEKQFLNLMAFSWVFQGFAYKLRGFMGHELWNIHGFLTFFHAFFQGYMPWKILSFSHENAIKFFLNSHEFTMNKFKDFMGFQFIVHVVI